MSAPPYNDHNDPRNSRRTNPRPSTFTREELAVLKECNSESFWYRCIPLSVVGMGVVQYLTTIGKLKPHPKYGTLFKNLGVTFIGYFVGKLSYRETCKQKILERVPNSRLAKAFTGEGFIKNMEMMQEMAAPPEIPIPNVGTHGSPADEPLREQYNSFDLNDRPMSSNLKDLDDNLRPSLDRDVRSSHTTNDGSQQSLSYDELRQRNRSEFAKIPQQSTSVEQPDLAPSPPSSPQRFNPENKEIGKKNIYGDIWDK